MSEWSRDWEKYLYTKVVENRGGCRCSWPTTSPPCSICTTEINKDEAQELLDRFCEVDTEEELEEVYEFQQYLILSGYDVEIK